MLLQWHYANGKFILKCWIFFLNIVIVSIGHHNNIPIKVAVGDLRNPYQKEKMGGGGYADLWSVKLKSFCQNLSEAEKNDHNMGK